MVQGTVYRSTGSWYSVKDDTGKFWNARIKGVMKLDGLTSTNPVAVGDVLVWMHAGAYHLPWTKTATPP